MSTTQLQQSLETVEIQRSVDIAAPIEIAFQALLEELVPKRRCRTARRCPSSSRPGPAVAGSAILEITRGISGGTSR